MFFYSALLHFNAQNVICSSFLSFFFCRLQSRGTHTPVSIWSYNLYNMMMVVFTACYRNICCLAGSLGNVQAHTVLSPTCTALPHWIGVLPAIAAPIIYTVCIQDIQVWLICRDGGSDCRGEDRDWILQRPNQKWKYVILKASWLTPHEITGGGYIIKGGVR